MTLTSLASLDLWARHEKRCVEVLTTALERLDLPDPDDSEHELNRRFYFCIAEAARAIEKRDEIDLPVVVPEGLNPPLASDQERNQREFKRPDFYWAYHDHDGDEPIRQFVVECKRITLPSSSWIYTEQYVTAGVLRFIAVSHAYGKAAPAGAMVGYLQAIDEATAAAAINACLQQASLPELHPVTDPPPLSERSHAVNRGFPESPFLLRHFWRA